MYKDQTLVTKFLTKLKIYIKNPQQHQQQKSMSTYINLHSTPITV